LSIINDAIKKARRESGLKDGGIEVGVSEENVAVIRARESSETKWIATVVVSLVVTVTLLGSVILYRHISRLNSVHEPDQSQPIVESKEPVKSTRPYRKSSVSKVEHDRIIKLNGIVYGPKDKWAIINNRIVREGETIPGGKLTLIKKEFVKIQRDSGKEIILNLR